MAGLLTHLTAGLIGASIIFSIFRNWKYCLAFFAGHLAPDLIDFGIPGILSWTFNPGKIMLLPLFNPLMILGHTLLHWILLAVAVVGISFILYKLKKIKKKTFVAVCIISACWLAGTGAHLILDNLIIEKNYWI